MLYQKQIDFRTYILPLFLQFLHFKVLYRHLSDLPKSKSATFCYMLLFGLKHRFIIADVSGNCLLF